MINDTPQKTENTRTTENTIKPAPKATYDGGFHVKVSNKQANNTASKRGACQSFTFAR